MSRIKKGFVGVVLLSFFKIHAGAGVLEKGDTNTALVKKAAKWLTQQQIDGFDYSARTDFFLERLAKTVTQNSKTDSAQGKKVMADPLVANLFFIINGYDGAQRYVKENPQVLFSLSEDLGSFLSYNVFPENLKLLGYADKWLTQKQIDSLHASAGDFRFLEQLAGVVANNQAAVAAQAKKVGSAISIPALFFIVGGCTGAHRCIRAMSHADARSADHLQPVTQMTPLLSSSSACEEKSCCSLQ